MAIIRQEDVYLFVLKRKPLMQIQLRDCVRKYVHLLLYFLVIMIRIDACHIQAVQIIALLIIQAGCAYRNVLNIQTHMEITRQRDALQLAQARLTYTLIHILNNVWQDAQMAHTLRITPADACQTAPLIS